MADEKRLIDANAAMVNAIMLEGVLAVPIFCIENTPTVDVEEVIHAEWRDGCGLHNGKITYHSIDCSHCQGIFKAKRKADVDQWKEQFVYCPFCGAIMDGGNEDG